MSYHISELLDLESLQSLLDSLDEINSMPSAVLDLEGNILTATAWQDICTGFHRVHPEVLKKCSDSDVHFLEIIRKGATHVIYTCPQGLVDAAVPIIVDGEHVGNVFVGQLLLTPPDKSFFANQACKYGFDTDAYLQALDKVPVCSEETVLRNLKFIGNLVQLLAEQGLQRKRHHESEAALLESESKLKAIFDKSEAGIIVLSPQGNITFANRRMAEMFGFTVSELIGSYYIDHVHESDKKSGYECMHKIIDGELKTVELERHYVRKDGSSFWGNLAGTRFENVDGSMRDQIIVITDITELKKAEEIKAALERQLIQAQKLESLGVLAGGIAHDFNNLLTVISGNCYMIKLWPENAVKYAEKIEETVDRAAELCRQMLAYAGKSSMIQYRMNLVGLAEEMVSMMKTTLPQNVIVKFARSVSTLIISGDSSQLAQIIMNLATNASEAIGDEQGEVAISLYEVIADAGRPIEDFAGKLLPAGKYACLEVTDNGCGMDQETAKRIFEPFYTTKFLGRGLGMSAVLGIISSHGGALQFFSQIGTGTTFRIYFPLFLSDQTSGEIGSDEYHPEPRWPIGSILLVEDDEHIREIAKTMLGRLGYDVLEASDGVQALEVYRNHTADISLVITDIGMPVMDGYDLFRELKNCDPKLPVIVASGFGDAVVTSRIPQDEIAGFINKPYNYSKLRKALEKIFGVEKPV